MQKSALPVLDRSTMMQVGLTALGGSHWIAGVQYLQSLLFGNSLLPIEEQAALRLYLDFENHRLSDYAEVRGLAAGVHVTDFSNPPSFPRARKIARFARTVVRQHRWPSLPARDLPGLLRRNRTDAVFVHHPDKRISLPQICWIPDFQHVHRPDFFSVEERRHRDASFARMMAEADRVIVSNHCSYVHAVELYPEKKAKLALLPFTMFLGRKWRTGDAPAVVRKYDLPHKFLLLPAQFWKHKNHMTVFRSIELLRERGFRDLLLACSGRPHDHRFPEHANDLRNFLVEHRLESAVRILGLLPRPDQVQLMRAAAAIIQPSFFEGWSAVLEECRSMGKTIFASDIPMHREQLAEGVHLFDPNSAEALADLIARQWPDLAPGPDMNLENSAENLYHAHISQFARNFISVCHEAASPPHSR